jgi:hypothetical protein
MYSNLNYIKRGKGMRQKARTSLGYIGTRPGKNGEKLVRELFGRFGTYLHIGVIDTPVCNYLPALATASSIHFPIL